jgi:cytochrome c peroxidase
LAFLVLLLLTSRCREADLIYPQPGGMDDLTAAPAGFPPIPFPPDNQFSQARWELGKQLFYDPVLSIDSTLSCASCHKIALSFSDDVALSPGVHNRPGTRNASPLINLAYSPYILREGSLPSLEMQILVPIQEENEFAHNIVDIAEQLKLNPEYVRMSQEAYNREPDAFVITRSISTFERTLVSGNSPYDQYQYQDRPNALNYSQKQGMELFFSEKTNCSNCHSGINLTNYLFENNGLYEVYNDEGRMRFSNDSSDLARFKVPTLRNIALTAPYMHDGSFSTLEEVVEHYNRGGFDHPSKSPLIRPLALTNLEKKDLVNFLEALTDLEFVTDSRFTF